MLSVGGGGVDGGVHIPQVFLVLSRFQRISDKKKSEWKNNIRSVICRRSIDVLDQLGKIFALICECAEYGRRCNQRQEGNDTGRLLQRCFDASNKSFLSTNVGTQKQTNVYKGGGPLWDLRGVHFPSQISYISFSACLAHSLTHKHAAAAARPKGIQHAPGWKPKRCLCSQVWH